MPAYLVHRLAGELAAAGVKGEIPDAESYKLGLQGGDLFFFRFHRSNQSKTMKAGYALHAEQTKLFFEKSMQAIKENANNALISYFCGYIVHYCVDKTIHPFVYTHTKDSFTHNSMEFMLDSWYLRDVKGLNACEYDIARDFGEYKLNGAIGIWYQKIIKELYGLKLSNKVPVRAQKDFSAQRKAIQKESIVFKISSFFVRRFTGLDVHAFMHPKVLTEKYFSKEEYKDMKQKIEKAAWEAAQKISCFLYYIEGKFTPDEAIKNYDQNFMGDFIH